MTWHETGFTPSDSVSTVLDKRQLWEQLALSLLGSRYSDFQESSDRANISLGQGQLSVNVVPHLLAFLVLIRRQNQTHFVWEHSTTVYSTVPLISHSLVVSLNQLREINE